MKFYNNKAKQISSDVTVDGIDKSLLHFYFKFIRDSIEFGIKGRVENEKVVFEIPALNSFIAGDLSNLRFIIDVNDGNKFYKKVHEGSIEIERAPEVNINSTEDSDTKDVEVKVHFSDEKDIDTPTQMPDFTKVNVTEQVKPRSAFRSFLEGK